MSMKKITKCTLPCFVDGDGRGRCEGRWGESLKRGHVLTGHDTG